MKNIVIFLYIILILVSCDYPFFPTQEAEVPSVAVSAFFTADSVFRVKVEPVANAFSNQLETLNVEKVKVINRKTNQTFLLSPESDSSTIYCFANLIPSPGDIFTLEVYVKGYDNPITATDTIPEEKPGFRLVDTGVTACTPYGIDDDITVKPSAVFRFMPNPRKQVSYYEFFIRIIEYGGNTWPQAPDTTQTVHLETTSSLITAEDYYPSNPVVDELGPLTLLFRCTDITDSLTVDFSYYTSLVGDFDSLYIPNHDLCMELREVSYSYYKYKTTLYCQEYAIDGNFIYGMPAPVTVYSNVKNGTGILGAYHSLSKTYYVESKGICAQ